MRPPRLLLVDDSRTSRLIARLAIGDGYEVIEAGSGPEALELARSEPPDVVLLDVVMPGMSGLEVCERLRASEPTRRVPILLTTTRGDAVDVGAAVTLCDGLLHKPLDATVVQRSLRALLHPAP